MSVAAPGMRPDMNWLGALEHHARRTPDAALAVFEGATLTYAGMVERAGAVAGALAERGVGTGDVVALLSHNCTDFLTTIFAANHLGAVAMPINWRLAPAEVAYILGHSRAAVIVCDDAMADVAAQAGDLAEADADGGGRTFTRIRIAAEPMQGWEHFEDLVATGTAPPRVEVAADDLHRLMYTSGTTGRPKGVMISHANLAWKNHAHIVEFGATSADVGLACGPLYHVGALDLVTTTMIASGATTVIHRTFDAEDVVDEIEASQLTWLWTAPAMVRAMLEVDGIEDRDLSSVRVIIAGGEKMPVPFIERLQRIFPSAWFADAYGLTETVSGDTFLDRDSTISKLGSVGRPCQYLELDVWDDTGASVPPGERGEIVMRGPKLFRGYWRDPEATAKAFEGGWFHTGDVGVRDEDGYLFIVDRLKDMIVSGGENIASSEVERVLYEHDAVVEAAVVGRPDERWGEVPVAFVVVRDDAGVDDAELLAHCGERLAKFKTPKAVHFIDELPRNPSGKVLKRDLRDRICS